MEQKHEMQHNNYIINLKHCNTNDISDIYKDDIDEEHKQIILDTNRLKMKKWMFNDTIYKIIRYHKELLSDDIRENVGLFRSVICDQNSIKSFSPPKSVKYDTFVSRYSPSDVTAEEFVEGTMINIFWDGERWELATRSSVGGKVSFFTTKSSLKTEYENTFRFMFLDALNHYEKEETSPFFDSLKSIPKNICLSFVLQHPKNRIVIPFAEPSIYLVAMYRIDGYTVEHLPITDEIKTTLPKYVKYPLKYDFETYNSLKERFASNNTDYKIVGVMLKFKDTHIRAKIRNPNYEMVRELRGNQPKLQFRYLMLRQKQRVGEYLKYYPEHKEEFARYRQLIHDFSRRLHQNYLNCYVFKQAPLRDFPYQYRTHMYALHEIYTSTLCHYEDYKYRRVTMKTVIDYVNKLPSAKLMYSINYPLYEHHFDEQKEKLESNVNKK